MIKRKRIVKDCEENSNLEGMHLARFYFYVKLLSKDLEYAEGEGEGHEPLISHSQRIKF